MRKVVVLDLDGTLWNFHSGYTARKTKNELESLIFPEVRKILSFLKQEKIPIAIASASPRRDLCLEYFSILFPDFNFDFIFIENCSKIRHFSAIKAHFYCNYNEMYFFDDQQNFLSEARSLGINAISAKGGIKFDMVKKYVFA